MKINKIVLLVFFSLFSFNLLAVEKIEFQSGKEKATLIELFTSQGCSSCPPAEKWINAFLENEELWQKFVPVAFHVDYWDYLGWKDNYAKKEFTKLQKSYYKKKKLRGIYTPALLVNGKGWRGGKLPATKETGIIKGVIENNQVEVFYEDDKNLILHFALLGFGVEADIKRGENANRVLPQEFLVLDYQKLENKNSDKLKKWNFILPKNNKQEIKKLALAIWISDKNNLQILQATGLWL